MSVRCLPVRPNLDQLKHQAKDLLNAVRAGDPAALHEFRENYPGALDPAGAKLADAQLVLARSYQASSWTRLVQAIELVDAIWSDNLEAVRALVTSNRNLLREETLLRKDSNWGPPMTYAANLGRDRIIQMLHDLGATDHRLAVGRAVLQGQIGTARMLRAMLGNPAPPDGALAGPAYTLSVEGTAFALEVGARLHDDSGRRLAPVDVVLETDARNPAAKHAILELYSRHGLVFPDSPVMALHPGAHRPSG